MDILENARLSAALGFFKKAIPSPTEKNFQTQLGVHLEEISEMLLELTGNDEVTADAVKHAQQIVAHLSAHLKHGYGTVTINNRTEFLDSLCDQLVTAIGVGYMANMNIEAAFGEVNRSNLSKFDANGEPIFDNNLKITKGPNYFKPNLKPFATQPVPK